MITVRNGGRDYLRVTNTGSKLVNELVEPGQEETFVQILDEHFVIERVRRLVDRRFDPRGGDPYNRVGSRSVP